MLLSLLLLCDPLQVSGVFWVFLTMFLQDMSSTKDGWQLCTSKKCQAVNLPSQAFAIFEIVSSAPITMGITITFMALWILLILSARFWYLSNFSSLLLLLLLLFLLLLLLLLPLSLLMLLLLLSAKTKHFCSHNNFSAQIFSLSSALSIPYMICKDVSLSL